MTFSNVHSSGFRWINIRFKTAHFETTTRCKAEERSPDHDFMELSTETFSKFKSLTCSIINLWFVG